MSLTPRQPPQVAPPSPRDPAGPLVLVVEDDANDVLLLRRAFAKVAFAGRLAVVTDGDAAVAYLDGGGAYADRATHPLPRMVLLDLKLPRRSGLEVLTFLRANPETRRIPVIVFTGSALPADVERCYDVGANSYLVKPVGFDDLLRVVKLVDDYWLHTNRSADNAAPGPAVP